MAEVWKTIVSDYVSRLNRLEAERSVDLLRDLVADDGCLARRSSMLRRLDDPSAYPLPIRCETRAKPVRLVKRDQRITAELKLTKRWHYEARSAQERIEYEKLTLECRRGEWRITKVDSPVSERNKVAAIVSAYAASAGESLPYINRSVLDNRDSGARTIRYNREAARQYANLWWNSANPKYHRFEVDCTSFVSQCLFAGGMPMHYTGRRDSGWWYEGYVGGTERWSFSWAVAQSLQTYLLSGSGGKRGIQVGDPRELSLGDIISYDWDGDSRFQHTTIVTAFDPSGYPLVNAHTNDSLRRYWDYRDSYAWTTSTRYTFIHIPDHI